MSKLLEITTEHVIPFKTLIEGLKDILNDINFEIIKPTEQNPSDNIKKKVNSKSDDSESDSESDSDSESESGSDSSDDSSDEDTKNTNTKTETKNSTENSQIKRENGGIKIAATDSTKTLLINVKLDANQFTQFSCKKKIVDLGINLGQFHKLIKSLDKDDTLSMYINEDDKQNLILKVSNSEKDYNTVYKLKLMEINKTQFNIPQTNFEATITFDTSEFHRICREMSQIAEHIEIKCTKNMITFSCKGDCSERITTYQTNNDSGVKIKFASSSTAIIQGIFELKNLVMFSKYSNLCGDIQIFMKNNYPLCIKYHIATLGRLFFCLTPIKEDDITENFSDEDDDYGSDNDNIKYKN